MKSAGQILDYIVCGVQGQVSAPLRSVQSRDPPDLLHPLTDVKRNAFYICQKMNARFWEVCQKGLHNIKDMDM